jgi:hypothetical protein
MSDRLKPDAAARISCLTDLIARLNRNALIVGLLFVLMVTVAVRLYQPTGWLGSDDAAYYSAAEHILTGTPITRAHHHYARMAVIVPVAASVAIFGHYTWAVALPMFVASVGCVLLVVAIGKFLFGWREGLLAGLIVSLIPYFRILSTTAYADTHVCLWVTTSILLCVIALRARSARHRFGLFLACGFALGLAISSKVFAATAAFGIIALVLNAEWRAWRRLAQAAIAVACGALLFFLVEGAFYSYFAKDFLFSLHAHEQTQQGEMTAGSRVGIFALPKLIRARLGLLFEVRTSGWGWFGVAFWPVMVMGLFFRGTVRCLVLWATGTYLLIAFFPMSLEEGYRPYPLFHGRHILPACIPFALCLAYLGCALIVGIEWILQRFVDRRPAAAHRQFVTPDEEGQDGRKFAPSILWSAAALSVVMLGILNPRELSGFRDRPTGRFGMAVQKLVEDGIWDDGKAIFMTPSTYWRYRILFPEALRSRLRVAVAEGAPDWWRDVTPDIAARLAPLRGPENAHLVATPIQFAGFAENWDYGVALPREALAVWKDASWLGVRRNLQFSASTASSCDPHRNIVLALGVTIPDVPLAMHESSCPCSEKY